MPTCTRVVATHFEGCEPCVRGEMLGRDLIDRHAVLYVRAGRLARVDTGQVRRSRARMIAWSVAERVAVAVGESRKHDRVLTEPFERLEHARILESKPFGRRRPVRHRDAVRHVGEGEAEGRGADARRGKRGRHRIQGREGDHRPHPSQERAPRDVLARHNHGMAAHFAVGLHTHAAYLVLAGPAVSPAAPFSVTLRD